MSNYGIKIAKEGTTTASTVPTDYNFWSKYETMPLLYKTTISLTAGTTPGCYGTATYSHSLGYFPTVIANVSGVTTNDNKYLLPYSNYEPTSTRCDVSGEYDFNESFTYNIGTTSVQVVWSAECVYYDSLAGTPNKCPRVNTDYTVDLYFFMNQLGE